jgi:hypothetical protein
MDMQRETLLRNQLKGFKNYDLFAQASCGVVKMEVYMVVLVANSAIEYSWM